MTAIASRREFLASSAMKFLPGYHPKSRCPKAPRSCGFRMTTIKPAPGKLNATGKDPLKQLEAHGNVLLVASRWNPNLVHVGNAVRTSRDYSD